MVNSGLDKGAIQQIAQSIMLRTLRSFVLAMLLALFVVSFFGTSTAMANNSPTITSFTADKPSPQLKDTTITFTANATGGMSELLYRFWLYDGESWQVVKDYSTDNTFVWTPTVAREYGVAVQVKSKDYASLTPDAGKKMYFKVINQQSDIVTITSFTADKPSPQLNGTPITFTATASGGASELLYRFWLYDGESWQVVKDYSTDNTFVWTPTVARNYMIAVQVKVKDSLTPDAGKKMYFEVVNP